MPFPGGAPILNTNLDSFMDTDRIHSVDEITGMIRSILTDSPRLQDVRVRGEISNFHHQVTSGHMYFTLKSRSSQIRCVSFRSMNRHFEFVPANGMNMIARGHVNVYEARGEYQLVVREVLPDGMGDLHAEFERLKAKLRKEGLFDDEHKLPIPQFPRRIGVASGAGSAALNDVLKVIGRRFPGVTLEVVPTMVQGAHAEGSIIRSLRLLDSRKLDTLILARGGGSLEDLWAFNLEPVAREIFAARTPIITGIGHQTDFTLSDFVADMRAPTPSVAAEMAVPDAAELLGRVGEMQRSLVNQINRQMAASRFRFEAAEGHILVKEPHRLISREQQAVGDLGERVMRSGDVLRRSNAQRLRSLDDSMLFRRPKSHVENRRARLLQLLFEMNVYFRHRYESLWDRLGLYTAAVVRSAPTDRLRRVERDVGGINARMAAGMWTSLGYRKKSLDKYAGVLGSLSPLGVLERGYSLAFDERGRLLTDASGTGPGEMISVRFRTSGIKAEVKKMEVDIDDEIVKT